MEEFTEFDALVEYLREYQEKNKERVMLIEPQRLLEFQQCYNGLLAMTKKTSPDAKANFEMNWLGTGVCSFNIETNDIVVDDIKKFIETIKDATNLEIYPLLNGNIRIGVVFYNVLRPYLEKSGDR